MEVLASLENRVIGPAWALPLGNDWPQLKSHRLL